MTAEAEALALLDKQRRRIVLALREAQTEADLETQMERALAGEAGEWDKLLTDLWLRVGADFNSIEGLLEGKAAYNDLWRAEMLRYIRHQSSTKIVNISDTTRRDIRYAIQTALEDGLRVPEIAGRVDETLTTKWRNRANMIARTEVCSASDASQFLAAETVMINGLYGLPRGADNYEKVWDTITDGRERPWHRHMDGVVMPYTAPFVVNGEEMQFPHDANHGASANNIIQCRCTFRIRLRTAPEIARDAGPSLGDVANLRQLRSWAGAALPPGMQFDPGGTDLTTMKPTMEQFLRLVNEYPAVGKTLKYLGTYFDIAPPGSPGEWGGAAFRENEWAHTSIHNDFLGINPHYYGHPAAFQEALARAARNGFHPMRAVHFDSVITHEYGHALYNWMMTQTEGMNGPGSESLREKLLQFEQRHADMYETNSPTRLDGYGAANKDTDINARETWAEGFLYTNIYPPDDADPAYIREQRALLELAKQQAADKE